MHISCLCRTVCSALTTMLMYVFVCVCALLNYGVKLLVIFTLSISAAQYVLHQLTIDVCMYVFLWVSMYVITMADIWSAGHTS
jgi:hypothetical protein